MPEKTLWGIHAGKGGNAEDLFIKGKLISIGWSRCGDLSRFETREDFKQQIRESYPAIKPGTIPVWGGVLYRFVHEIQPGDWVIFHAHSTSEFYVGEITGDYQYVANEKRPGEENPYVNQRTVRWIKHFPRRDLSQAALYELGSAVTLFQVKNFVEEIFSYIEGHKISEEGIDEVVSYISADIEQQTTDFILKKLERNLKGEPFEKFVRHLLEVMGYNARLMPKNEPSVDIIAHKDELGVEPPIIKVQVKSVAGKTTDREVSALAGKLRNGEFGLFVTLSDFTSTAMTYSGTINNMRLIDGETLVGLILEHYDQLNASYKSIIPLKKVYIPKPVDSEL